MPKYRRFCSRNILFCLQLGSLFQLPGIAVLGKIADCFFGFYPLIESLCAHIIILVLVNLPMCRRPGGSSGIHGTFLLFGHAGCFIRGDLGFAETQVLGFFRSFVCIQLQLFLFGYRLLDLGFFRWGARGRAFLIFLKFQLSLFLTHAFPPSPRTAWWS